MEAARLNAAQLSAGRIEAVEMVRAGRDTLQAAQKIAGDFPILAAIEEWRKARDYEHPHEQLAIADVTLQEIGLLLRSGRIWFKGSPATVLGNLLNYVTVLPITLDIAIAASALALPHGDQFDRIITATAKVRRLPLVTMDANITNASVVATLW